MVPEHLIHGFSGFSREEKIRLAATFAEMPGEFIHEMQVHWHNDHELQNRYTEISENAVSNYYLPYSLAPNFLINGKSTMVPMVTEESSVVAAAASAAKFWWPLGGFVTRVKEMHKRGHIHFIWKGDRSVISAFISEIAPGFYEATHSITRSMSKRGGGILSITLKDLSDKIEGYYQLEVIFNTMDAMGANFINSCLEKMAGFMQERADEKGLSDKLEIVMAILSNYTPHCLVECKISCGVSSLSQLKSGMSGTEFARKFEMAVLMASHDVSRAVTHNKGIYNGVDAVVVATGNDFRAVEAAGHAWASRDGSYRGLTRVELNDEIFSCSIEIPLPLGVVGGLTSVHPMAKASLMLLGNGDASSLMSVAAAAGMANNFSAIRALISGGIQRGHMKLHLRNMLNRLGASNNEKMQAEQHFKHKTVSHEQVKEFLVKQRNLG